MAARHLQKFMVKNQQDWDARYVEGCNQLINFSMIDHGVEQLLTD
jgi:hypothetical protein